MPMAVSISTPRDVSAGIAMRDGIARRRACKGPVADSCAESQGPGDEKRANYFGRVRRILRISRRGIMNRIQLTLLIATLMFASDAPAQSSGADNGIGVAQVNEIYPDLERLYIDLHRNPE